MSVFTVVVLHWVSAVVLRQAARGRAVPVDVYQYEQTCCELFCRFINLSLPSSHLD